MFCRRPVVTAVRIRQKEKSGGIRGCLDHVAEAFQGAHGLP